VPIHAELVAQEQAVQVACALAGGDDYELCFTAAPEFREKIAALARPLGISLARIGHMFADHGQVCVLDGEGNAMRLASAGFDHFSHRET
jgi:thiamine-monophosphate kinase